jgi:hypothetical protein
MVFGVSGVLSFVTTEPCSVLEQPWQDDGACPPTCVTCGCCAQSVEAVSLPITSALEAVIADIHPFIPRLPKTAPHDILHVPKQHFV